MHGLICNNIHHGRCFKTIFKDRSNTSHEATITHLFTRANPKTGEAFAITMDQDQIIKRWNLNTGKCEWGYRPKSLYGSPLEKGKLCLSEKDVIYYGGKLRTNQREEQYIRVIDLTQGKPKHQFPCDIPRIYTLGNKLFGLKEGGIQEVDLITCTSDFHAFNHPINLQDKEIPDSERFVVDHSKKTVLIYDRIKHKKTEIDIKILDPLIHSISCTYLKEPYLYCGFNETSGKPDAPLFCKIDLEKSKVIEIYRTDKGTANFNSVNAILVDSGKAYIGHSSGKVIVANFLTKNDDVIDSNLSSVNYLALENGILISGSTNTSANNGEVKFWDTKSLEHLKTMEFPQLQGICIAGEKVLALIDRYLMQWDFQCFHEGKVFTPHSLQEEPEIKNPLIEDSEALSGSYRQQ